MSSQVKLNTECVEKIKSLESGNLKYIIFGLNEDCTEIVVEKTSNESSLDTLLEDLPGEQCRWVAYDFDYEAEGEKMNKMVFISWAPANAKTMDKMNFAISTYTLVKALGDVADRVGVPSGYALRKALCDVAMHVGA